MLAPIMLGGFHKVALLFCNHPRGTPQNKFFAEDAPFYRISGRVQVLKTVACNKELCIIPDPLQKKGRACLGRRKREEVQNVVIHNERPKFQSFDRVQALARGDMMFRFSHCAEVNGSNS